MNHNIARRRRIILDRFPVIQALRRCTWCDDLLGLDTTEQPRRDDGGGVMCDECHHEHFEFWCCWCQNYGDRDIQHDMVVVIGEVENADGDRGNMPRGVYRVCAGPYYCSAIFDGWFYGDALKRLADVPDGVDTGGYPAGHLCADCQARINKGVAALKGGGG